MTPTPHFVSEALFDPEKPAIAGPDLEAKRNGYFSLRR